MMERNRTWSCEEALRRLALYLDGELDLGSRTRMEEHLHRCRTCYSRAEFERRLKERLAELGREPVPDELRGRIETLVSAFAVTD
jgi:anti-sigma factor (TIGR02949 family)